jgi:hypothetical protein
MHWQSYITPQWRSIAKQSKEKKAKQDKAKAKESIHNRKISSTHQGYNPLLRPRLPKCPPDLVPRSQMTTRTG